MKLIYRCLCAVLGAILGSGCSNSTEPVEYGPMPEYGVPSGTVRLDGRVLNDQGGPIPGVEVSFAGARPDTTDASGNWVIDQQHVYIPCSSGGSPDCFVVAVDIDGGANGGPYPVAQQALDPTQTEPGSGGWDQGTWEQHAVDIVMTEAVEYGPPIARAPEPKPKPLADTEQ
jgi:putative lipoprotein (rSAM/lipoprotein system)